MGIHTSELVPSMFMSFKKNSCYFYIERDGKLMIDAILN